MDPNTAALLASTLFPTSDHSEWMASFYGFEADQAPLLAESATAVMQPEALGLTWRRISDTEDARNGDGETGTGEMIRVRVTRGPDGEVMIENLEMEFVLLSLRVRPVLGDKLDFSLITGSWEQVWRWGDTGRAQWRFYSPMRVNLLSFSNTDMDDDDKLKYYIGAGSGVGGEVFTRVAGPLALQVRADVEASAKNRYRAEGRNTTRQEIEANAELGLGLAFQKQAVLLSAWGQHITQWEPRDAEGRDGVDRQYLAAGLSISARFYEDRELADPRDLDEFLELLREGGEGGEPADGIFARPPQEPPPEAPPPEAPVATPAERDPSQPLEVHWSEVEPLGGAEPLLPAGLAPGATCTVRFFIDPTGQPYDVRPEACPSELLAPTMEAAWTWRFTPVVENGDTVSAQFTYTFTPALAP